MPVDSEQLSIENIRSLLAAAGMHGDLTVELLDAEASHRRYARVMHTGEPYIVSSDPQRSSREDFVSIGRYLHERGLGVPEVLFVDEDRQLVLMTDGGATDLSARLGPGSDYDAELRPALDLLVKLHAVDIPPVVAARPFDQEKLLWEMDFLADALHYVGVSRKIDTAFQPELNIFLKELCGLLGKAEPRVFTHRDYHARNLLYSEPSGSLTMIDFQDARVGLPWYDLSSLLLDPYTCPGRQTIENGLRYYCEEAGYGAPGRYRALFFAQALQRLLKALGTYLYMSFQKDMHHTFFRSIEPALNLTQLALQLGGLPDSAYLFIEDFRKRILPALDQTRGPQ